MLAMSDIDIKQFIPYFAELGVKVAFLVPTPTGYGKSIMDATISIRLLLADSKMHNYELQKQGPENKVIIPAHFVNEESLTATQASLYRPITKQGDPRIWFYSLTKYCNPCNLLAIFIFENELYIANLSNKKIADSLINQGFLYQLLKKIADQDNKIAEELLSKIQLVHNQGFLPTITVGDPGVGDTLEHALGINRNNQKTPDYKGIELKASRKKVGSPNRSTLFDQVPDWSIDGGMGRKEILESFGYWGTSRDDTIERFQLYCTLACSKPNSQGLVLEYDEKKDRLNVKHNDGGIYSFVTAWDVPVLRERLLEKHPATFWVKATSRFEGATEFFRYDYIKYTKNPNVQLFTDLLQSGIITVDFLMHRKENGVIRDHGFPFKILPQNIDLLFPKPIEYDLTK